VAGESPRRDRMFHAEIEVECPIAHSGWLAARCTRGDYTDAHTSPIYLQVAGQPPPVRSADVDTVIGLLDRTLGWVERHARCETPKEHERLARVFLDAKELLRRKVAR